jgi:hypothetical protein
MAAFNESLINENSELVKKLGSLLSEEDLPETLRELNYMLKQKIAKQQTAIGEVADPVGVSPKEMKSLRKSFNKFDKDGSGAIEKGELKSLTEELAEPLTEEELNAGMESMGAGGKISFDNFVAWIQDERDKESHKGMKMRMLKLKMRATHMKSAVKEGLARAPSFAKEYVESPDDQVRFSVEMAQAEMAEGKTKMDLNWAATPGGDGSAEMKAAGAPDGVASMVCINIQLLDGIDESAQGELAAIYDQIFEMANGEEMMQEMSNEVFLHSKPRVVIATVDGVKCLQIQLFFTLDPLGQFNVDGRHLKTFHGRMQWDHLADEVLKEAGEQLDLMALEGLKFNFVTEIDRKLVEYLSANEQLQAMISQGVADGASEIGTGGPQGIFAAALMFGSVDMKLKTKSVMEVFNKTIRDNIESYNEMIEEYEDKRYIDAEIIGTITEKIVQGYAEAPGPVQKIYDELKSKIAGPHSIKALVPTGAFTLSTTGLDILHKFFPTTEEIQAHDAFKSGDADDDDEDW